MRNSHCFFALTFLACIVFADSAVAQQKTRLRHTPGKNADRTLTYAIEAAQPFVQNGFTVREEYWGGTLPPQTQKIIVHQLFKGNEYWFLAATDADGAVVSVHAYDENGNLAETEYFKKAHAAGTHIVPRKSAMYYIMLEIEKSPELQTRWALVFGFR